MLIAIDGIDGCGKSTQVRLLAEAMGGRHIAQISPSRWGAAFRALKSPSLAQQLALFTADRAHLAPELEAAAGSESQHLVSDRSYLSGIAYQSFGSGLSPEFIEELNRTIVPAYDLQIYLHIPLQTGFDRISARGEQLAWCETPDRLEHAMAIFARWTAAQPQIVQVDGVGSIEEVQARVAAAAEQASVARFGRRLW